MRIRIKYLFLTIIGLILLSSCAGIDIDGDIYELRKYDTLAVIEFIVSPPVTPILPLIDAAIYNNAIEEVIPNILDTNKSRATEFAEYTYNFFKDSTNLIVYCGLDFYNSPSYVNLTKKIETYPLDLENEDFTKLAIPSNSYNFFNSYEILPLYYFDDIADFEIPNDAIAKIADEIGQNIVAVIVTGNNPISPGFYNSRWGTINETKIYFFKNDGKLLLKATLSSEIIRSKAYNLKGYSYILDRYKESLSMIVKELYTK